MIADDSNGRAGAVTLPAGISLTLLALMGCLPFLVGHHQQPIPSFAGEWLAVALGLLATAPLLARRYWQPLHFPLIAFVPLGLMAVAAVQAATGLAVYWQQHLLVALYLAWAALMMVLGSALRQEIGLERLVPALAWGVLAGGAIGAVIVGLQMAGVEPAGWIFPHGRAGYAANLAQPNQLADLLGLSLASLLYLLATGRLGRISYALLSLAMLVALALTGSRAGWLYVVALVMLSAFFRRRNPEKISGMLLPASLLPASLLLVAAFAALQWLIPILHIGGTPMMPSERIVAAAQGASIRLQLFEVAWRTFGASPWLGAGIGQFAWHDFMLAETVRHNAGMVPHAQNLFAHLLAETGLAGTLVVLTGIGVWLFRARRVALSPERWWLLALLGVLFIHSMLDNPLWYAYFLGLAALLLGMGEENSPQWRLDLGSVVMIALLGFGALSLANIGMHYDRLEGWARQAAHIRKDAAKVGAMLDGLSAIRRQSLLAPYADRMIAGAIPPKPELATDLLAINQRAMRFLPDAGAVYRQSLLLALDGKTEEALLQLRRAMIRHPRGLGEFSVDLAQRIGPQTMPLLMVVIRHNRARLGMSEAFEIPENPR